MNRLAMTLENVKCDITGNEVHLMGNLSLESKEKQPRKIVQIAVHDYLYALCNDGSVWYLKCGDWCHVKNIGDGRSRY